MPTIGDLISIARAAGDAAATMRNAAVHTKTDGSAVSDADLEAEKIILDGLARFDIPILSEESVPPADSILQFVVDPIDGTADFIEGSNDWCVMIGLRDDQPLMAVVYAPARNMLWSAERGKGSFVYEASGVRRITVSNKAEITNTTLLVSVHHRGGVGDILERAGMQTQSVGSMGIKLGLIAMGDADAHATAAPLGEWDICAPHLIVEEAGGAVTDLAGNPLVYSNTNNRIKHGLLATNRALHKTLVGILAA